MKYFHISHTDLDGYTCQLIAKEFFPHGTYINANYGLEVKLSLDYVANKIEELQGENILIIISDLNLNYDEAKWLDDKIKELSNTNNIKLQLLDHHISGQKCADEFEWYYLDISRSATKIVYDYFNTHYIFTEKTQKWLAPLVNAVNAVDIWLDNEIYNFEFGKVCMHMMKYCNEINQFLFADESRNFRHYLLKEASNYIPFENGHIRLDNDFHTIKKNYLKITNQDDTLDNLVATKLVNMLGEKKEYLTIHYGSHKGLLTYTLGSISIVANEFLKHNSDFDFFADISKRGVASFRAKGNLDVSKLASKLANGGGHKNAAGCKFEDFKETIYYDDVKNFFQKKLNLLG
ncbi:DHH family phosphoesterase [Arcobacter sp. FWKO B]|uniref:DHH family phosphoesterase n=1 Tax=Arcobacter sp. FWKO B TaxID=2593672 RepID=UPI0018A4D98E|nr:phosphoesterase [Arcobacter sp. FWKO B]QOG12654.1 phosphoesterase [Arcobacter sp. FWKO B]